MDVLNVLLEVGTAAGSPFLADRALEGFHPKVDVLVLFHGGLGAELRGAEAAAEGFRKP